jgi:predicted ester cyclase
LVGTFGEDPEWHNKPSNDVLNGHDAIRGFYRDLFAGFPDFWLDIHHRRLADDAIVVDGVFGGTHDGVWMDIPPTGKKVAVPFCAVFTFTNQDLLKSEIVYYDRLTLLEQLGVVNQPS